MKEEDTRNVCKGRSMALVEGFSKQVGCADFSISQKRDMACLDHPISKKKGVVIRGQLRTSYTKRDSRPSSLSKCQPWCKSVSSLDLSCTMTCTPSYRLLPIKYMRPPSSLHPLRAAVLNDHWVCVPANHQNYHLGCSKRNAYEKRLQDCEEDCCQIDVLLESTKAAAKRMEELIEKLDSSNDVSLVGKHLTVLDWQCCKGLTDECGPDLEDKLKRNPHKILPLMIEKLKGKEEKLLVTQQRLFNSMKDAFLDQGKKSRGLELLQLT